MNTKHRHMHAVRSLNVLTCSMQQSSNVHVRSVEVGVIFVDGYTSIHFVLYR